MGWGNSGGQGATVAIQGEGLPGANGARTQNPVPLQPSEMVEREFAGSAKRFAGAPAVNHFRIVAVPFGGEKPESFDETFLMPEGK